MSFSLRAGAGQGGFRPSRNVQARSSSSSIKAQASGSPAVGMPAWCIPALMFCAATPIYTQVKSKKMIEEGWARHYAKEAASGHHSTHAPKGDLVLVESIKQNAAGVPERVMVLIPSDSALAAERERKWVKPTVRTAVGLGVGAAAIGAAAYFDKKQKEKKL